MNRGRAHHPARQVDRPRSANACAAPRSGVTTRAGCTTGGLRPWNRSGNPRHRRRRTGSGRTGGHAGTGGGGDHLPERSGHATMAQRGRLGVADGRPDPGRTPSLTSTGRVQGRGGVRAGWLKGGFRRSSARRRPSWIHCAIMLSSAPAAMHSWAAALALGSSSLPSLAPSTMPATSASRSARLPATSRSSVAAAAISGSVGLRQRACRLATPSRRATSRRSGTGPGRSGAIRPESNMYPVRQVG